ncbi:MAG: fluoride efflux transporter FluC [Actinocrinis sp.]
MARGDNAEREGAIDGGHRLPIDPDLEIGSADRSDTPGRRPAAGLRVVAAVAVGGFLGGLARYEIGSAAPTAHGSFPATTFAINVAGSFILALLVVFVQDIRPSAAYLRPLLGTGFCGALTTFSTWMVDTDRLLGAGHLGTAAADLFGSLAAGLAATSLGLTVGRSIVAHRARTRSREREPEMADA